VFPVSVAGGRKPELKIPNIDFKKIFFIPRLEFQQITDNLFNKPIALAAERPGKSRFSVDKQVGRKT